MPVYGKGRGCRAKKNMKMIDHALIAGAKRRFRPEKHFWPYEETSLKCVERNFGFSLTGEIARRCGNAKSQVTVLDWGCGKGTAATELAQFGGKNVKVYGCSDVSYEEWLKNDKVKFIHETAEDTLRYFKDGSLDIIYSYYGLWHLEKSPVPYIGRLAQKLKKGGKIIIWPAPPVEEFSTLQKKGFRVKPIKRVVILIERG